MNSRNSCICCSGGTSAGPAVAARACAAAPVVSSPSGGQDVVDGLADLVEDVLGHPDRQPLAHGQRQRVRRAHHQPGVAVEDQLGGVDAVDEVGDLHPFQGAPERLDDREQHVLGEGGALVVPRADGDDLGLRWPQEHRHAAVAVGLAEQQHRLA